MLDLMRMLLYYNHALLYLQCVMFDVIEENGLSSAIMRLVRLFGIYPKESPKRVTWQLEKVTFLTRGTLLPRGCSALACVIMANAF